MDIPGNSSTTASITVGSSVSDTLEVIGDHDWFKITLTAGQSISVSLDGITLEDPYLRIYDANGNLLYENDDISSGIIRDSELAFTANYSGTYYIDVGAWDEGYTGTYQLSVSAYTPPPVGTAQDLADQLTDGYWGGDAHHFNVTQGGTITVNITALTPAGQSLALAALATWTNIIGVNFVPVTGAAQITFDDNQDGAFSDSNWSGGIISSSHVNVSTQWLADYGTGQNSYSFQTYIHEIGHALGLGHQGNYNGQASFPYDASFYNDSWAMSVMSYFSQTENTYFAGQGFDENFLLTPMMSDILAMSALYGLSTTYASGDNTYVFSGAGSGAQCIYDAGGTDWIYGSGYSGAQLINLNPGTFSNINGDVGNVSIAFGVTIENALGGSGADNIIGNNAANWLEGGAGNDTLSGGAGNDTLKGGSGNNTLDGGNGTDTADFYDADISGGVTANLALGTADRAGGGHDTLIAIERLSGTQFNDALTGDEADNALYGQAGNDQLNGGGGNDQLYGAHGDDTIAGGSGVDRVWYDDALAGVTVNLATGVAKSTVGTSAGIGTDQLTTVENVAGSQFADIITGNNGANVLDGLAGNDTLDGGAGADVLNGGLGDDILIVDNAGDLVAELSGEGMDEVRSSIDYALNANVENLRLMGAAAIDGYGNALDNIIRGNEAVNLLLGAGGADKLYGYGGDDNLDGGEGDDYLYGLEGNDTLIGANGYDRMYGGVGDDTYSVNDATDFAYELAGEGHDRVIASLDHQLRDQVEDLELVGSAIIGKGNAGDNGITGNGMNNRLYGYGGNDVLDGGQGDDIIDGREGNDTLIGGIGYDKMYGGTGDDTFIVTDATDFCYELADEGTDKVIASVTHALRDNIEQLELSGTDDIRGYGNGLNNLVTGNEGANLLYGRDGHDTLRGNGGNDLLYGEDGNDILDAGAGQDRFYGGAGADQFIFKDGDLAGLTGSTADRIMDFSQAEGDQIDLAAIDANTGLAGDQGFSFIGTGAFTHAAGELRTFQAGGVTYLQGDTNGDGAADFLIRIDGLHTLQTSDFVI